MANAVHRVDGESAMFYEREEVVQPNRTLLYWTTLIYAVGVPNFLHFDTTGKTHSNGLFNLTSLSAIAVAMVAAYLLFVLTILRPSLWTTGSSVSFARWLWVPLLLQFFAASTMQPPSRLTPPSPNDLLISSYRIFEWLLLFGLCLALCRGLSREKISSLMIDLIGKCSWIWIAMVWCALPLMPSQVYGESDAMGGNSSRLGGQFLSPSYLATLAIAGFFYALIFVNHKILKFAACLLAALTIILAHTRIEQIAFALLLLIYYVLFSRSMVLRVLAIGTLMAGIAGAAIFQDAIIQYVARGQSVKTLATMDDRLAVWQAGIDAGVLRPYLGYGFVVGAKDAIRDHWKQSNWIPPHAHNEFIHAFVTGGIPAAILVACIYGRLLWSALRNIRSGPSFQFLFLLALLFCARALGGANITIQLTRPGAIFILAFFAAVAGGMERSAKKAPQLVLVPEHSVA
jgi:O-antigen ligase